MPRASAIARRTLGDSRVRDGCFALFLGLFAFASPVGYRHSYPTAGSRLAFARSFGSNKAVELFYGVPHDLLSVGGFTAWRFGGFAALITGVWGALAAVRAFRAEEEAGRRELVLAAAVSRRSAYLAALVALAAATALLWLATLAGLAAGRLPAGGAALLALATISPAVVFAAVGTLTSQLAATRRLALGLAVAALGLSFLVRVTADLGSGLGWLRWVTPLGWSEEVQAFAHPRPAVLALPALTAVLLFAVAGAIDVRRDVGTGVLRGRDIREPNLHLLSSPTAFAIRSGCGSFLAWLAGFAIFAGIIGILSVSFTPADISSNLQRELGKIGGATITTAAGALGFYFLLFVLATSLYACSQVAAVRREEADQQLETLFALPVGRRRWLAADLLAWAGAASQNAGVSPARLIEAGANCLPTALLFLGLATLAFGLVPRAAAGLAYGLVTFAFVWELFGSLLGAPHWLLEATPFAHVGLVPAQAFRPAAAATLLVVGCAAAAAGVYAFSRRDLVGA